MALFHERSEISKHAAPMAPRLALGATMVRHGSAKIRARDREKFAPFFESLGFRPGGRWVLATGLVELGAGVLSMLGIGTRVAALGVLVTQGVAISKVHAKKGFSIEHGGAEFNVALCAIALSLLLAGPGRYSLHGLVERRAKRRGRWWERPRLGARLLDFIG